MKLLYPLAKRFIAGHSFDSAKGTINNLIKDGYGVSIDYIGENSKTVSDSLTAFKQYLKIIKYYKNKKINLSIKPTQLGILIHTIIANNFIDRIAKRAKENSHTIRLDMEDKNVTELTRNLAISLNKKYKNVGVAVQANLYRTWSDVDLLIENNVSIRLVKGAYKGDIKTKEVKEDFYGLAIYLKLRGANNPAIATHDEELLNKIDNDFYDYEFLYGIRRDLQKRLMKNKRRVSIYIPFGENWLSYTLRRLKEFKNLKFVIINIFKEIRDAILKR